jgi:hypothetical protein
MVKGRRVVVIYDADPGEQKQAANRADELCRYGADAWTVQLTQTGLHSGQDVSDWFTTYGRSRKRLLDLINRERRRSRRRMAR